MRKLVIAAAVSMSLATISVNTHALSLGEIEMYSALNQTLDAEINIVSFAPGELEGISVGLAPAEAFAAAGLQRSQVLSAMRFEVERRPDGVPVVKISSNGPIIEPFLSFLLQIDSPQGSRLIREYTVLLDPPVFTAQQSELIEAAPAVIQSTEDFNSVGVSTAVERNTDLLEGVSLDLASELGGENAPIVTFDESSISSTDVTDTANPDLGSLASTEAVIDDSDALGGEIVDIAELLSATGLVQNLDSPVRVAVPGNVTAESDSGELLDLSAELIDQTPELTDNSDGIDVQLDQLPGANNVIFDNEATADFQDTAENIVSLDSLADQAISVANNDTIASVTNNIDRSSPTGEAVDLNSIIPDISVGAVSGTVAAIDIDGSEIIDLNSSVFEPEVTLEQVTTTTVPATTVGGSSTSAGSLIASFDEELGEAIDISGIVPGEDSDFSDFSEQATFSSDTYRVRSNDTLWSIARSQKANGVSTQQMVRAILDANQEAFVDGDMNRLRNGAELRIPASLGSVNNSTATTIARQEPTTVAPVESEQATETAMIQEPEPAPDTLTIVGVDESAAGDGMASTGELTGASDLDRDLEAVNKKMMLAQEELTSESLQRDELSSRVVELEESLAKMKKLITLRESELGNLQTELQTELQTVQTDTDDMAMEAEEKARELEISQADNDAIQKDLERLQNNINADTSMAQERIDAQADADKNLASAEAEAKSVRLATEEDALKSQLAQLQVEKAELIETAQNDKLALVQQAEAEKAQLLSEAKAEQERIQARLEAEKTRITEAAAAESARVADEAQLEKEKLLAEANAERDRLSAESEAMRTRLEALELEKDRLLAESEADKAQLAETTKQAEEDQSRLQAEAEAEKRRLEDESTKVKDKLAALQAEASANLSTVTDDGTTVASNVMDKAADAGSDTTDMVKDLTGKGAAAAGGMLAIAPLQRVMGDRKNVLAAGGGLALLGLLGAWAMRRRRPPVVKNDRDIPLDIDTNDDIGQPARAQFESRGGNYDEVDEPRSTMGRAAVAASAVAAATGVAVSRDASANEPEQREEVSQRPVDDVPVVNDRVEVEPGPARHLVDNSLLDDTITEADVYLRYGLHGQAEDLLQTAIERAPDNEEYHLKLLENYHDQKNAEGFKTAAANYKGRFETSAQWDRIAEMGRSIDPREGFYSRDGSVDSGAGGAAMATGAVAAAAAAVASTDSSSQSANLDETMDAGAMFNVDDLAATGDFSRADDTFGLDDLDDISLDEVDLAALDDDGTLNLEDVAGNQMSGLDLGSLDLTNPDGDSTLDNLTLDDADLNSLGDVTSNVRSGLESDLDFSDNYSADSNEMETMLDLAKAYIDMGDSDSAANALKDIVNNGNAAQQKEASDLLKNLT